MKLTVAQKRVYDQLVSTGGAIVNHWNNCAYLNDFHGNHLCWIRQSVLHNLIYKKKIYMDKDSDVHHRTYKPIL